MDLLKRIITNQKGQALPLVLGLLLLGGVTLAPTINFAASSLTGIRNNEMTIRGRYAADAGVEYVIWAVRNGQIPPLQLPENVNDMAVSLQYLDKGIYTLYLGELVASSVHLDYLAISGDMVWDAGAQAYKFTITITWQPDQGKPVVHLDEVGAKLPRGYTYWTGSANSFPENLSRAEPTVTTDVSESQMLNWVLGSPAPSVSQHDPVATQSFYINESEVAPGDYSWVVADRDDAEVVGTVRGYLYIITATATRPQDGVMTGQIKADVIITESGSVYVISWKVLK